MHGGGDDGCALVSGPLAGVYDAGLVALLVAIAFAASYALIYRRFSARNHARDVSEQRLRELVEAAQAVLWRSNLDGTHCNFVNREAEKRLGYPIAQWLAEPTFWIEFRATSGPGSWPTSTAQRGP